MMALLTPESAKVCPKASTTLTIAMSPKSSTRRRRARIAICTNCSARRMPVALPVQRAPEVARSRNCLMSTSWDTARRSVLLVVVGREPVHQRAVGADLLHRPQHLGRRLPDPILVVGGGHPLRVQHR